MELHSPAFLFVLYGVLLLGLLLVLFWSTIAGRYPIPLSNVLSILASHVAAVEPSWSSTERVVVEVVRLPRVLTAGAAGAGLSL
ncbi:MAG: hypothetical protein WAM77_32535, partial [Xanthobacteraceae bacterium]